MRGLGGRDGVGVGSTIGRGRCGRGQLQGATTQSCMGKVGGVGDAMK
jgi:hypothetical protein